MVLEKQDNGISLTSTDGHDGQRKMADGEAARDLVKGRHHDEALLLSKSGQKFGGSDKNSRRCYVITDRRIGLWWMLRTLRAIME